MTAGCWNPLHPEQLATANDSSVRGWDLRTMKYVQCDQFNINFCRETYTINQAHTPFVRDLDFNALRDYYLVTGGDDYKIRFWDTRRTDQPVKSISGHSHWYITS